MDNIELSVLVLTYNQEKYIGQTIEAIVSQISFQDNIELIIADDCSSDKTREIIKKFQNQYSFIKPIFNKSNKGLTSNYYDAISECSGTFIMECGGDDKWIGNKINRQLELMRNDKSIGACCGGRICVDEHDNELFSDCSKSGEITFDELLKKNVICASTVCFRKELWNQYFTDIQPNNKNWKMEDYPFWLWLCKNSRIVSIDEKLCIYRVLDGSISHSSSLSKRIEFEDNVYQIAYFYAEAYQMKKLKRIHMENVTNLYYLFNDLQGFRKSALLENTARGYMKFLLSFFPNYFKMRKQRKDKI